ncbi:TM2 domain-containing protein [Longimicrobium sp.]|uniref:TM2 domain-containing protein n=1 Tax=Longimicrobium sp. TaxID=2029185 RepID=UPI002B6B7813|nr:NINE protein [Longimicrobium sp.]HSU12631.1 NINE protein [Longimicrobium sp.]
MYPNQPGPYNQGPYQQAPYQQPYPQYNPYAPAPYAQPHGYDAQRMMLYDANKKSAGVAYALWFFLGMFGAHRFYMNRSGSAAAQLVITVTSWILLFVFIGLFTLFGVAVWVLIDAFLIPDWIREHNNRLANGLSY